MIVLIIINRLSNYYVLKKETGGECIMHLLWADRYRHETKN